MSKFFIDLGSDKLATNEITRALIVANKLHPHVLFRERYGRNSEIDTGQFSGGGVVDIWHGGNSTVVGGASGRYTAFDITAAGKMAVKSTSELDTAAGTGARTVRIFGLNSDYVLQSEIITLNGTTPVLSALDYLRCSRAIVQTAGSTGVNQGILQGTLEGSTFPANTFFAMPPNRNRTHIAAYTIPAGYTGVITSLYFLSDRKSGGTAVADLDFFTRETPNGVFSSRHPIVIDQTSNLQIIGNSFIQVPEKTDMVCRCLSVSANDFGVSAGFELLLFENEND